MHSRNGTTVYLSPFKWTSLCFCTKRCGLHTPMSMKITQNIWATNVSRMPILTHALVFGLPDESVPEKLFLVFYPTADGGLEKKTISNSTTATVREVLEHRCRERGVSLSSLTVKDKHGVDVNLDSTLHQVPHRIIILGESKCLLLPSSNQIRAS